jgi:hypothetical protein
VAAAAAGKVRMRREMRMLTGHSLAAAAAVVMVGRRRAVMQLLLLMQTWKLLAQQVTVRVSRGGVR